jgi:hypothetical protein
MGIRDHPIASRSPWQNAYVERLIGSIRRECLDHMIVFGEAHLRRILRGYAAYYNVSRTHRSLNKDAPLHRAVERLGTVVSRPVLGGLHHNIAESSFWNTQPRLCRLARLGAEANVDRRSDDPRAHHQAQSLSTHAVNAGRSRYFAQASKLGKAQFWPVANGRGKRPASQRVGYCPC